MGLVVPLDEAPNISHQLSTRIPDVIRRWIATLADENLSARRSRRGGSKYASLESDDHRWSPPDDVVESGNVPELHRLAERLRDGLAHERDRRRGLSDVIKDYKNS